MRYRVWVLLALLLLHLIAAIPISSIKIEGNYEVFFDADDPRLTRYHQLEAQFSSSDTLTFMLEPATGDVFQADVVAALQALTDQAWNLPFVSRVDSLASAVLISSSEHDIVIDEVFPSWADIDDELLTDRRARVLDESALVGHLVSEDGRVAAINITIDAPGLASDEPMQVVAAARQLQQAHATDQLSIRITGLVAINNGFAEGAINDILWLGPLMMLVMTLAAWWTLRSLAAVAAVLIAMFGAQWLGLGLASWSGIPLTPPSASGTSIIATLAVANAVHVIAAVQHQLNSGSDRFAAIAAALRENLQPVALTTLTTIVGFLSLNSSTVPPYRFLGNTAALGIACSFVLTYTLLPLLLHAWGCGTPRDNNRNRGRVFAVWVMKQRLLALGVGAVAIVLAALAFNNRVDDDFVAYFTEDHPVRANAEYAMKHLSGVYTLHYALNTGQQDGAIAPEALRQIQGFSTWAEQQPRVNKVVSVLPVLERVGKALGSEQPLPDSSAAASQYLLLYQMGLPPGHGLEDRLNADRSSARVIVIMGEASNVEIRAFTEAAERWMDEQWASAPMPASGPILMFVDLFREATLSTIKGLGGGALLIAIIVGGSLRSARLGTLSLLPNALPALMALGVWSLFDGTLNVAASSVAALSFGIIVDDTIHILTRYRRARNAGRTANDAMVESLSRVARPITSTTIILTLGFSLLAFSDFGLNITLGLLTAMTITLALALDFLALPKLVVSLDRKTTL